MESIDKAKNVIDYYVLCAKLKNIIRSGWKNWNVSRNRLESVAEHVYGTGHLAIAMWSEYKYDLDIAKVMMMLTVHELEEIIIGDLTEWDATKEEKSKHGYEAIKLILGNLLQKEQIKQLIVEFEEQKTKEAIFAFQCDKLECDIQSKLYDEEGCVDLTKQENNPAFNDPYIQELLKNKGSWSGMWLEFSRNKFPYDINFTEVSNYVENNNIGTNNLK